MDTLALASLPALSTLLLSHNQLDTLPGSLLASCLDLDTLDLSHNKIQSISKDFFKNTTKLRYDGIEESKREKERKREKKREREREGERSIYVNFEILYV